MIDLRPIPAFPDYAITPTGEVYRNTDPPRLVHQHMQTNGRSDTQHASVRFMVAGRQHRRGVAKLVREVWGDE